MTITFGQKGARYLRQTHGDVPDDYTVAIGVKEILSLRVASENNRSSSLSPR
jgi:hypothetical protein